MHRRSEVVTFFSFSENTLLLHFLFTEQALFSQSPGEETSERGRGGGGGVGGWGGLLFSGEEAVHFLRSLTADLLST